MTLPGIRKTGLILFIAVLGLVAPLRAEDVATARAKLYSSYNRQLQELAVFAEQQQLVAEAKHTKTWLPERDPLKQYIFFPAPSFRPFRPGAGIGSPTQQDWWERFSSLRKKQADALFALAKQALSEHQTRLAYELAVETVRENPDHEQARVILGHQKYLENWDTAFSIARTKGGQVWHEKYGWIPSLNVARYDQGMRFTGTGWVKAAEEAKLHENMQNGWKIDTEHYQVLTNHSLEEGVKLSRKLERLYWVWKQVYFTYHTNEEELTALFTQKGPTFKPRKQLAVAVFKDQSEYNSKLKSVQPNIEMTLGMYFNTDMVKGAFFFAGEKQDLGTIYHEATHQLFSEVRTTIKEPGKQSNFWMIEAIACFMESWEDHEDFVTVGGYNAGRVPAARQRLLMDGFYMPLADLSNMGMETMQKDPNLPKLYSQSSGLALFFMSGQGGKYREPFAALIDAVYSGKGEPTTLSRLTAQNYEQLDREYAEFLKAAK